VNRRLGIIGAGGHGKVVADVAERAGWPDVIFFDSRYVAGDRNHGHWSLVSEPDAAAAHSCDGYFVAIGNSHARQQWCEWLLDKGLPLVPLVDPSAGVSQYTKVDAGVLVAPGAVVNVDSQLAIGSIINTGARVDHDCHISSYSHVCPAAALAGSVTVGMHSWIGIGSQVKQGISIGSNVTVGAGATVVSAIGDGLTVVGTPARSR